MLIERLLHLFVLRKAGIPTFQCQTTSLLFEAHLLTAFTQAIPWSIIFLFASAGASAGYLTVSDILPLEVRAKAIAIFFALAQVFGALGPTCTAVWSLRITACPSHISWAGV